MNIQALVEILEATAHRAQFVSAEYTAKKNGERAIYVLRMHNDYIAACQNDILELQIRASNATGIELVVLNNIIASLQESINARKENREHVLYTKRNMYRAICPGIKLFLKDSTLELQGFEHNKRVVEPGVPLPPVKHRTAATAMKAAIEKTLRKGQYRTLCLDTGNIHTVKLNGEVLEFE